MPPDRQNIYTYFHQSVRAYPDHTALHVNETGFTYRQLEQFVNRIVPHIRKSNDDFIGLFAQKSLSSYAGVLAILKAGKAYVPLSPKYPTERNKRIRETAELSVIIADTENVTALNRFLNECEQPLTVLFPDAGVSSGENIEGRNRHTLIFREEMQPNVNSDVHGSSGGGQGGSRQGNSGISHDDIDSGHGNGDGFSDSSHGGGDGGRINTEPPGKYAYLLFTSGSTGRPKGVPVTHQNVCSYVDHVNTLYDFHERDRISQTFDLTFDPSVHDLFVGWSNGSALYSLPEKYGFLPAKFISRHKLTVWYSVPSIPRLMNIYGMIKPNMFPDLRFSLFSGEALHAEVARLWHQAAPNSIIDNLYGPTEITINISMHRWDPRQQDEIKSYNGIMSIGKIFPGHRYRLLPENETANGSGKRGELAVSGGQVVSSYFKNEEATEKSFKHFDDDPDARWYCTGDIVKTGEEDELFYAGRKDSQIKIRGNRVELGEIKYTIESLTGPQTSVLLPYPYKAEYPKNIMLFLLDSVKQSDRDILRFSKKKLPDYMVPRTIHRIPAFPLNTNGKIDNKELVTRYENGKKS